MRSELGQLPGVLGRTSHPKQCVGVKRPLSAKRPGEAGCSGSCGPDRFWGQGCHVQLGRLHIAQSCLDKIAGGEQNPADTANQAVDPGMGLCPPGKEHLFLN